LRLLWTVNGRVHGFYVGEFGMTGKKANRENQLNDYFRGRCCNYENFTCDRVWECALCARQSVKVEPVTDEIESTAVTSRRR
jgi:hypothetical protein